MSSGATTSAGRAKKDGERCWEGVVAMGVAWVGIIGTSERNISEPQNYPDVKPLPNQHTFP